MSKNVLVMPLEVIIGSPSVMERATKALCYFAIAVTFLYMCITSFFTVDIHQHTILHSPQETSLETKNVLAKSKEEEASVSAMFDSNSWVDEMAPVHYPWPNDKSCKDFTVKFAKNNTWPPRALVSFPGSGNSWLRYLVECSSGIFTGSLYVSDRIYDKGLYGELRDPVDGSTILQKTHFDAIFDRKTSEKGGVVPYHKQVFQFRGILVIRNPYKAIFSYWNFLKTSDQIAHVNSLNSSDTQWIKHVEFSAEKWASMIFHWTENSDELLVVQYEQLKKSPRTEITKILKYLQVPVDRKRLDCLMHGDHLEGPFHRQKSTANEELQVESADSTNKILLPHIYTSIYPPPLDTLINHKIQQVNQLFLRNDIPIHLRYTMPR